MASPSQSYTSLMAPSFEAIIQLPVGEIVGTAATPGERYARFTQMVMAEVESVEWTDHGLEPLSITQEGQRTVLQPAEAGPYLAKSALKDTTTLINGCVLSCEDYGMPRLPRDYSAFGVRLLNSADEMLRVTYLGDGPRQGLSWILNDPHAAYGVLRQPLVQSPIRPTRESDQMPLGFVWSEQLSKWIINNTHPNDPAIGCPARQVGSLAEDGTRQQLTQAFWDKLVTVTYLPNMENRTRVQ